MIDRATKHALDVVEGREVAGELHWLACKRHLDDLEKSQNDDFPYRWDAKKSNEIIEYAETLTISEGFDYKPVKLYDFQCFDLGVPMGWINKEDGYRRYRRSYISMARQNGKTFLNGIRLSYISNFSKYRLGKLFTVATKKRQAKLAWDEVAKFIRADEDLEELFDIKEYKGLIIALDTMCTIECLSKEAGLDDGFRSICSSIDELHQHRDNKIYKAIYNGTRSLPETLVSMITTRGDKLNSFCFEMDNYCINILRGTATAEDFFVDIHSLNEDDDPFDPKNLVKANPLLARTKSGYKTLVADMETAKSMGGMELRDFLVKALNMWIKNYETVYINPDNWKKCGTENDLEKYRGKSFYLGLDLSSGGDLTSYTMEFEEESKEDEYYIYSHSFMPRGRLQEHIESDIAPYDYWETQGLITVTGSESDFKNDYKFILADIKEKIEKYELKILGIGYDPHNIDGILSDLEEFGVPLMMVTQSAKFLNDATEDIRLLVKSGKYHYNIKNELLTWSFINAKIVKNSFGEMKIDKEPRALTQRIDPCDAAIDAHCMRLKQKEIDTIDVESEMEKYLKTMGWKK